MAFGFASSGREMWEKVCIFAFVMRNYVRRVVRWILCLAAIFFILSVAWVVAYKFINPPVTLLMLMKQTPGTDSVSRRPEKLERQEASERLEMPDGPRVWLPLDSVPYSLQLAVLVAEDFHFLEHHGIDMEAIRRAVAYNKANPGKPHMGGSTITQQTAKNVFLWPQRSWIRKGLEGYFTLLIELFWGKERILEIYLNVIETGPGIYGMDAAAHKYFNKEVRSLTKTESVLIAAILCNPVKYDPRHPNDLINWKKDDILYNMTKFGRYPVFTGE